MLVKERERNNFKIFVMIDFLFYECKWEIWFCYFFILMRLVFKYKRFVDSMVYKRKLLDFIWGLVKENAICFKLGVREYYIFRRDVWGLCDLMWFLFYVLILEINFV